VTDHRYIAAGKDSSEYRKALRLEIAGYAILLLSVLCAGYGLLAANPAACLVGCIFGAVSSYMLTHSSVGYANARARVKASALAPPPLELQRRSL